MKGLRRIAAAALLLAAAACKPDPQAVTEPPIRPVLSVVATVRTSNTLGPYAGTIEPRYKSDLGFQVFGRMVARFVDVGDVVKKGQELAALDPAIQALAVRSAQAAVVNAEAQLTNAQGEELRQRDLLQKNITPPAQYEIAQRTRDTAQAALTRALAALHKAKETLGYTQLRADFDGVVTNRFVDPGQVVNAGQKIVAVARPEIREAVIAVPIPVAELLSHPNDFTIMVDLDNVVNFKASGVRSIDPVADASTRTRTVYLTLDNPPTAFRLGITISVTLSRPVTPRVDLPATAILEKDGKSFVWVIDPAKSTVSQREVTVASRDEGQVIVTQGITAGERIVTAGVHSLRPGQQVKVPQ